MHHGGTTPPPRRARGTGTVGQTGPVPAPSEPNAPHAERRLRLARPYLGRLATVLALLAVVAAAAVVVTSAANGTWAAVVVGIGLVAVLAVLLVVVWSRFVALSPGRIGFGSAMATHWMAVDDVRLVVPVALGHPMLPRRRGVVLLGTAGGAGRLGHGRLISSLPEDETRQVAAAERTHGPLRSLFVPISELDDDGRRRLRDWMGRTLPVAHAQRATAMIDLVPR